MNKDINTKEFKLKANSYNNWDLILENPQSIELEMFVTDNIVINKSGMLNLNHKLTGNMPDETIKIDVKTYLLKHEKFGNYLIDTGNGENISKILDKLSIEVKGVFFTHLHPDHISGVPGLSGDLKYIAGKNELPLYYLLRSEKLSHINNLYEINFENERAIYPFQSSVDLFGDNSFWAIYTPGHTDGHISYFINSNKKPVLITGDACSLESGYEIGVGPGSFSIDLEKAQKSLENIILFSKNYPAVDLIFGH